MAGLGPAIHDFAVVTEESKSWMTGTRLVLGQPGGLARGPVMAGEQRPEARGRRAAGSGSARIGPLMQGRRSPSAAPAGAAAGRLTHATPRTADGKAAEARPADSEIRTSARTKRPAILRTDAAALGG